MSTTLVAALDGFRWQRSLHDIVVLAAGKLPTNRFDHPEGGVDDIQLFRDALSQRFQYATTHRTFSFWWGDKLPVTGECYRKRFAGGSGNANSFTYLFFMNFFIKANM